jgi:hypothetical protein
MIISDTNTSSRQIFLNSKHASTTNNTGSNCRFHIQDLVAPEGTQLIVSVVDMIVPCSWYIVNESNNRLIYGEGGSEEYTLTIPVGNYSAPELARFIESMVSCLSSVSYSLVSNKILFFSTSKIFMFKHNSTCFDIFGLKSNENHLSFDNGVGINVIVPDGVVNLAGINSILVHSNCATSSISSSSGGGTNTLCRVPITVGRNSVMCYTPQSPLQTIHRARSIDYIDISLTDSDMSPIDFNGQYWSITLRVDFQFEKKAPKNLSTSRFDNRMR